MAHSFDKLKELDLSRDEVNRLGEALQKPEFRKLLTDYVEELQDPKNKKLYEEEVTQLEKERGVDVVFIHPNPGYVLKTSADGNQKAFINICVNDKIDNLNSSPSVKEGTRGLTCHLPHSLSPPRTDLDNKGVKCLVFDIVFHPNILHLAKRNKYFLNMVNETALDSVETNFNVKLDKKNLKFPKLPYKGTPKACVVRKASENKPEHSSEEKELFNKLFAQIDDNTKSPSKNPKKLTKRNSSNEDSNYTTPTYVIKHRNSIDIQEFVEHRNAKMNSAIPKELIVEVNLPLLKSSADIKLDVTEKTVQLISDNPAKYKLHLTLPYTVLESAGNAKFEKDLKKLVITLPVQMSKVSDVFDSGVDSDHFSPGSPESEEERTEKQNNVVSEIKTDIESKQGLSENTDQQTDNNVKCVVANSSDFRTAFLNSNIHYNFPEFSCHVFENIIAFTLNVKNVDEKSVEKLFTDDTSVHIKFTSIGSSFYPIHYAFYVQLPKHTINKEQTNTEVWDNNIILQVPVLNADASIVSYLYGIDDAKVSEKYVEEPDIVHRILEEDPENSDKCVEDNKNEEIIKKKQTDQIMAPATIICSSSAPIYSNKSSFYSNSLEKPLSRAIDIIGTSYESSGDELSCSSFSPRKSRSILKRYSTKRSEGRSISESSLDDFTVESSVENCYASVDSIPEDREQDGVSHSLKKTVRFSDVIGRQLFRSNSSILGQKKKNQRKSLKKKRAMERRHTQSEASESEEKKDSDANDYKKKDIEQTTPDNDENREDIDIFHIDIDY